MVVYVIKTSLKMKNKGWLSTEKNMKSEKRVLDFLF